MTCCPPPPSTRGSPAHPRSWCRASCLRSSRTRPPTTGCSTGRARHCRPHLCPAPLHRLARRRHARGARALSCCAQVLWALCVYLEAISVLPQLRLMQKAKARRRGAGRALARRRARRTRMLTPAAAWLRYRARRWSSGSRRTTCSRWGWRASCRARTGFCRRAARQLPLGPARCARLSRGRGRRRPDLRRELVPVHGARQRAVARDGAAQRGGADLRVRAPQRSATCAAAPARALASPRRAAGWRTFATTTCSRSRTGARSCGSRLA